MLLAVITQTNGIDFALLLLRVTIGVTIFLHGYNHVWGGGKIEGTARWFESLGFLTPLAAAGVVGVMVVALVTNHFKNGFFIFRPGEGYEYVLNLAVAATAVAGIGAGRWSVDHLFEIDLAGIKGLLIVLVFGVGGAALLLATAWRPEKKDADA
jgi:putative oxidoreductase